VPALEKAVALAPGSSRYVRTLGDAYGAAAQKAGLLSKMSWAKKCKAAYDKAVELDPKDLNARWCVMEFSRQAPGFLGGGMEAAYAQAAEIKKIDPSRGRAAYTTLYVSEKKYAEAFALYDEMLKDSPEDLSTLFQIGKLADTTGQELDRGLSVLKKCLTLPQPVDARGYAPIHWRMGNILLKKNDPGAARVAYQAALDADPKFTAAADSLAKLH
jgi:tetratricopeptide (TPR) repeat protein